MKFLKSSLWTDSEQFKEVEFAFQISLHHKNIFASCTIGRLYDFQLFCLHNNSRENQIEIKVLFWVRNWLWIGLAAPRESKKKLFALFLYEKIFLGSIGRCDTRSFHFPTKISISPCALSTLPHFSTVFPFSDGNYIRFGNKKYWISKFFLLVPQKSTRQLNFIQLWAQHFFSLSLFRKSIADVRYQISSADTIIVTCKL